MAHKLKQFINRQRFTQSDRLPNLRSRQFLLNKVRLNRTERPSSEQRALMGLVRWAMSKFYAQEYRVAYRSACFVTGRTRGVSKRYNIARTKIKYYSGTGKLFGLRKSSW